MMLVAIGMFCGWSLLIIKVSSFLDVISHDQFQQQLAKSSIVLNIFYLPDLYGSNQ